MTALNPIFEYADKGQYYEKEREWKTSIRWYHRALACLPNLYGADVKLWQFPHMGAKPIAFSPRHAGRIYAALGRCLMALDRREDGLLAFRAARSLDTSSVSVRQMRPAFSDRVDSVSDESACLDAKPTLKSYGSNVDLKSSLTLIIVTHCTDRLKKFEALSPPSAKLLITTYGSLLNVFGEAIHSCPKLLCYDINPGGAERDHQYTRAVEQFARQQGFELITYPGIGLFSIMNRVVPTVTTPYIMFVEHDWMFRGDRLDLMGVIEMMNLNPRLHSLRFNKRHNFIDGHDFIMQVDKPEKYYPLLRTSSHSNNPSIIRTDKMKTVWLPQCKQVLQHVAGQLGGSAYGIEEILFKRHVEDIRENGFDDTHAAWGAHVFGCVGDPPRIVHLGE